MRSNSYRKPLRYTVCFAATIFLAELAIMSFLSLFSLPPNAYVALASIFLVLLLLPALYYFVYLPLSKEVKIELLFETAKNNETKFRKLNKEIETALKQAKEEEEKTAAIIAAIGDGVSIQDKNFTILYQNLAHTNLIGDHLGKQCYKSYEHRDNICDGCPVAKTFEDGMIHRAERSATTEKGTIHVEVTASPLRDASGEVIAGIEVIRDITEQKKMREEILQAKHDWEDTFNTITDMITVHDKDFNIIQANKAAQKILSLPISNLQESKGKCSCDA